MNELYSWQAEYNAAVLETDNAVMALRVCEALAAIEQRRLSPSEIDGAEEEALQHAEAGLRTLRGKRQDSFEAQ
jgi:hypothetical protein